MFPFWQEVVAPVVEAASARRIVEIGALRGENTELMLQRLGPDVELHVIDPVPSFDPAEHERRFAGQYVFHQALSLDVLGDLPPMDVALIDGDHNWYTVSNELRLLAEVARGAGQPTPVMVLHDVAWPYGRRDLYYEPSNIPEEHRQPWRRAGMRPGRDELVPRGGGLNADLANAEAAGGPRNGVMTGVDDFIASHDRPLRLVFLPLYFGLAIVVEEERLERQPELARALDYLESAEGKDMLLRLGERIRLESALFEQAVLKHRDGRIRRLVDRYLGDVRRQLTSDAHHGDAEALDHLQACLDGIWATGVAGDLATCGSAAAGTTVLLAAHLEAHDADSLPKNRRRLWVVDRFEATSLGDAQALLARFDLLDGPLRWLPGDPAVALDDLAAEQLACVHLGTGLGADAGVCLERLYARLAVGGIVVVADLGEPGVAFAVEDHRARLGDTTPIERAGSVGHWVKAQAEVARHGGAAGAAHQLR